MTVAGLSAETALAADGPDRNAGWNRGSAEAGQSGRGGWSRGSGERSNGGGWQGRSRDEGSTDTSRQEARPDAPRTRNWGDARAQAQAQAAQPAQADSGRSRGDAWRGSWSNDGADRGNRNYWNGDRPNRPDRAERGSWNSGNPDRADRGTWGRNTGERGTATAPDRSRPDRDQRWNRGDDNRGTNWHRGDNDRRTETWRRDRGQDWRHNDHRSWNRHDWRRDNRYDWRGYRDSHRSTYRIGRYYAPYRDYSYRRLGVGFFLGSLFYGSQYWISDPWSYRLPQVYGPYRWVRYYDDVLLVNIYTGEVEDVIYDFFW